MVPIGKVAGLPNLYSGIKGKCTLKVEGNCNTEITFIRHRLYHNIKII